MDCGDKGDKVRPLGDIGAETHGEKEHVCGVGVRRSG